MTVWNRSATEENALEDREAARFQACRRRRQALIYAAYAAVSTLTFAAYALAVSAAGAPPSVHAAGLVLWVAHVILIFGRLPGPKPSHRTGQLGDLQRGEIMDRAVDAAAGLRVSGHPPWRRESESSPRAS